MRPIRWIEAMLLVGSLAMPGRAEAAELKPEAVQGFDRYVQLTERRMQTELRPGAAFLWVDGLPEAHRNSVYEQLQRGEVVSGRIKTRDSSSELRTPAALIHHWVGTVFIPGASLQQVQTLLEDYDHHAEYFGPEVAKSKTLEHTGNDFKVYLRLARKKIVTVVLDNEYEVHYEQLDASRAGLANQALRCFARRDSSNSLPSRGTDGASDICPSAFHRRPAKSQKQATNRATRCNPVNRPGRRR